MTDQDNSKLLEDLRRCLGLPSATPLEILEIVQRHKSDVWVPENSAFVFESGGARLHVQHDQFRETFTWTIQWVHSASGRRIVYGFHGNAPTLEEAKKRAIALTPLAEKFVEYGCDSILAATPEPEGSVDMVDGSVCLVCGTLGADRECNHTYAEIRNALRLLLRIPRA